MTTISIGCFVKFIENFQNDIDRGLPYLHNHYQEQHYNQSDTLDGSNERKFTNFAYTTLLIAWVTTVITGISVGALSLRMNANRRQFHQLMFLLQALVLLGYSLTLGGFGLMPLDDKSHILVGRRDEFLIHYILPILCLPFIVYITNNIAGIFMSEGLFIVSTLLLGALYGLCALWLPTGWLGSAVSCLSIVFGLPYIVALVKVWPCSVKAAPIRVRRLLKTICALQCIVLIGQFIVLDLAINDHVSVDIENLVLVILDILMYSAIPLLVATQSDVLRDVYCREEYIQNARRNPATIVHSNLSAGSPSATMNTRKIDVGGPLADLLSVPSVI